MSSKGARPDCSREAGRHTPKIQLADRVLNRQRHIAQMAQKYTDSPLTTLADPMDSLGMHEAFSRVKKNSASGVDGVSATEYAQDLESNLAGLLDRAQSGSYRDPPVKRKWRPKNEPEVRAIGIPTVEDKGLQRAVARVLEPIYEQEFDEGSYGFRPNRSAHQAMDTLRKALHETVGGWVLDADIRGFFDTIDPEILRDILRKRIQDTVILRLVSKWLNAGAMNEGNYEVATGEVPPQGGVISPRLSTIYLHEVLDSWFAQDVQPRLKGKAKLVRFADDFVIVFEKQEESQKVMDVLPQRFGKYGLELHRDKTRLVEFRPPWKGREKPETFTFLGLTFYWGKTRNNGYAIQRRTAANKLRKSLSRTQEWCKAYRHKPLRWPCEKLGEKLRGHFATGSADDPERKTE